MVGVGVPQRSVERSGELLGRLAESLGVLVGDFPPGYTAAIESYDKSWAGTLTMSQRGKGLNPGRITIVGCNDDADQRHVVQAFAKFTKKTVRFG